MIKGETYDGKFHLQHLLDETINLSNNFNNLSFNHIFQEVDALSKEALHLSLGEWFILELKDGVSFEFQHSFC